MAKDFIMPMRRLHGRLHDKLARIKENRLLRKKYIYPYLQKIKKNKKCIFLVLTPEHTNLGDHAIAWAEIELLKKNDIDYVEITGAQLKELSERGLLKIFNKHPIIINGGGNLGTLWFDVEQIMRDLIVNNPKSMIAIFPNSFYYEDSLWGKEELLKSQKIYNSHSNLHIYAREKISFDKMNGLYNDVKLVPDMVLSRNECAESFERKGCLICLRSDCEKTITESEKSILIQTLEKIFESNVKLTDTHSKENVSPLEREAVLENKYNEFKRAELVITDRLHGMIFCAITGTPCIVVNSKSPKVLGSYNWIENLGYIKFCNDVNNIEDLYCSIDKTKLYYDNAHLKKYYELLEKDLIGYLSPKGKL